MALETPRLGAGQDWRLMDRSQSVSSLPSIHPHGLESSVPPERCFVFGERVNLCSNFEEEANQSQLGKALRELRTRMENGDELKVYTDGISTDSLPDISLLDGIRIQWERLPAARALLIHRPPLIPSSGQFVLRGKLPSTNLDRGELLLDSESSLNLRNGALQLSANGEFQLPLEVSTLPPNGALLRMQWREKERNWEAETHLVPAGSVRVASNFHWQDSQSVFVPPEEADLFCYRDPFPPFSELRDSLESGVDVLLISKKREEWVLAMEAELGLFQIGDPSRPWVILLDTSGSMAPHALEEARNAMASLTFSFSKENRPQIWTFSDGLRGPFKLEELLQNLPSPHGPTLLAKSLVGLLAQGAEGERFLLFSDGNSGDQPESSWEQLGAELRERFNRVECVPLGNDANEVVCAALEGVESNYSDGRGPFLERSSPLAHGDAFPVSAAPVSLPQRLSLNMERPRFRLATQGRLLMQGQMGEAVLVERQVGAGRLLGLAADPSDTWTPVLHHLRGSETLGAVARKGNYFQTYSQALNWAVVTSTGKRIPFECTRIGLWEAGPLQDNRSYRLLSPQGKSFPLLGMSTREWGSSNPFQELFVELEREAVLPWNPTLLFLGVLCFLFSARAQKLFGEGMV